MAEERRLGETTDGEDNVDVVDVAVFGQRGCVSLAAFMNGQGISS